MEEDTPAATFLFSICHSSHRSEMGSRNETRSQESKYFTDNDQPRRSTAEIKKSAVAGHRLKQQSSRSSSLMCGVDWRRETCPQHQGPVQRVDGHGLGEQRGVCEERAGIRGPVLWPLAHCVPRNLYICSSPVRTLSSCVWLWLGLVFLGR